LSAKRFNLNFKISTTNISVDLAFDLDEICRVGSDHGVYYTFADRTRQSETKQSELLLNVSCWQSKSVFHI